MPRIDGAPGGGGYNPMALHHLGPVHPGRGDLDQHFAFARQPGPDGATGTRTSGPPGCLGIDGQHRFRKTVIGFVAFAHGRNPRSY
jgi:hypothetical protein